MKLTTDHLRQLAQLAQLDLPPEEIEATMRDLNAIIAYAASLDALDCGDVPPTSHAPLQLDALKQMTLRPDSPSSPYTRDDLLANAPEHDGESIRVPKVVDHG